MSVIANERLLLARSLWSATCNTFPATSPLRGDIRADVAIVGAGYTGLSTAIHLAERGVSAVVLEAEEIGWGASGRNGGQVIAGLKEDPDDVERIFGEDAGARLVRFAGAAPDVVFDLIGRFGIRCDAVRQGWIQPAVSPSVLSLLARRAEEWARRGAPVSILASGEAARLIGSSVYCGGLLDRRGGSIHPLNYAVGLATAALELGAILYSGSRVTALKHESGRVRVTTSGGSVLAEQVILCTNGYTDGLSGALRRSVIPVRSVQVASQPLPPDIRATILPEGQVASDTRRLLFYYRLDPSARLVIGGRGAFGDGGIGRQMARLRRAAKLIFPQIGAIGWDFHWGGNVAMTLDHFPHLHDVAPGIIAALGFNGRGVAMASAMGRVLAAKATGATASDLDYPTTGLRPIPLHSLRRPIVTLAVAWNGFRDRMEMRDRS